jgi:hypothetical protein
MPKSRNRGKRQNDPIKNLEKNKRRCEYRRKHNKYTKNLISEFICVPEMLEKTKD